MDYNQAVKDYQKHVDDKIKQMSVKEKAKFFDYLYKVEKCTIIMCYRKREEYSEKNKW